jgi:hypothetical protein
MTRPPLRSTPRYPRAQRGPPGVRQRPADVRRGPRVRGRVRPPRLAQRLRTRFRGGGPRPGPSYAGAGGDPRAVGGQSPVVPVRLPCGGCRRRLSLGTGRLGLLTACWVRAELDDRMRLNNWSIAVSYDTARIFAGLGFGSSTASRSIISRPERTRPAFSRGITFCSRRRRRRPRSVFDRLIVSNIWRPKNLDFAIVGFAYFYRVERRAPKNSSYRSPASVRVQHAGRSRHSWPAFLLRPHRLR